MQFIGFVKGMLAVSTLIAVGGANVRNAQARPQERNKVAYGQDNRVEVANSPSEAFRQMSKSVAAQIGKEYLKDAGENFLISAKTLSEDAQICSNERFADQKSPGNCSGFLVGTDILVTAGHCVPNQQKCDGLVWAFDYVQEEVADGLIPKSSVFKCAEVLYQVLNDGDKNDYAIIRLDRPATTKSRRALPFRRQGKVADGAPLVVIGAPSGLPIKIADQANVVKNDNSIYFLADLDTFGGNSGSPVFNTTTGDVEGILVRGERDYELDSKSGCYRVKMCEGVGPDDCRGEDSTRITNLDLPKFISSAYLSQSKKESPFHSDKPKIGNWATLFNDLFPPSPFTSFNTEDGFEEATEATEVTEATEPTEVTESTQVSEAPEATEAAQVPPLAPAPVPAPGVAVVSTPNAPVAGVISDELPVLEVVVE